MWIKVSVMDCTGCALCAETCPVHCLEMVPIEEEFVKQQDNVAFIKREVTAKPENGDRKSVPGIAPYAPLMVVGYVFGFLCI